MARHPILRTSFHWRELERSLQAVHAQVPAEVALEDWRGVPPAEQERRFADLLRAHREEGFALSRAPLARWTVVVTADRQQRLAWSYHHLLLDGWSSSAVVAELLAAYAALRAGREPDLPRRRPFGDYISWLERRGTTGDEAYWRQALAGWTEPTPLGIDRRTWREEGQAGSRRIQMGSAATAALRAWARRQRLTLNTLVQAAWGVLLGRYSGQAEVVFGVTLSGRSADLPGIESMVGLFINTLPLRLAVAGEMPLLAWLRKQQLQQAELLQHEHTPLARVQEWSAVPRGLPLFESILVFENYPLEAALRQGGADLAMLDVRSFEMTNYPLTVVAAPGEELLLRIDYDGPQFDGTTAVRALEHLLSVLEGMASAGELARPLDLPLLSAAERVQLLVEWGQALPAPPVTQCLHELFAQQACRAPAAVAVLCEGEALTYGELDRRADQLARHLRRLGVKPESRVALCTERSLDLVLGVLGILKAGGAYVPLHPADPEGRLGLLLADADLAVLVTQEALAGRFAGREPALRIVRLDADREAIAAESGVPLASGTASDNQAYVIYTSGSTGRPKGVLVSHANVVRLFTATRDWFGFGACDVWTLFHSYAFDFSVWELWGALLHGGRLVVVPWWVSRSPEAFYRLLTREGVTVLNQTPSAFRQLVQAEEHAVEPDRRSLTLREVIFGGEALDLTALRPWLARHGDAAPRLVNMYGITETTVHVTYRRLRGSDLAKEHDSPVGRAIPDLSLYLLDARGEPVPLGVAGEIHVGGAGLARGYLGRPELTAERFVPDPFGGEPGARLYKAGDLAYHRPDGSLGFLGRVDDQVKIRGFRIEPSEIEAALEEHPAVHAAVVLARPRQDGHRRLVAYVVAGGMGAPGAEELREFLGRRLPDHMVPALFVPLDALPLTGNGKVDRRALPEPEEVEAEVGALFVPPEGSVECALAEIWETVLGVERVGRGDSFFALGGDSILSLQVLSLARERGLDLSLQQLFEHPTIDDLARELGGPGEAGPAGPAAAPFSFVSAADRERLPHGIEDAYPLTRLQAGMLFHSDYSPESSVYHDVLTHHLQAPFHAAALREALARMTARHPVLRTSFDLASFSEPLQLVHREVKADVVIDDLRHLDPGRQEELLTAWLEEERAQPFDWSRAPLLRIFVHCRSEETFQLTLSFHHAILDGWSLASLLTGLFRLYLPLCRGEAPAGEEDGAAAVGFRRYVELEREALTCEESRRYWREALADAPAADLPRWGAPGGEGVGSGMLDAALPTALSEDLPQLARAAGVPLRSVLLAAHCRVLAALSGGPEVVTGLVVNGRPEEEGADRALGLFLNTVPLRLRLTGGSWSELARRTFEREREMLPHRRYPMADLQRENGGQRLFETSFNFVHFHIYQGLAELGGVIPLGGSLFERTNFSLAAIFDLDPITSQLRLALEHDPRELLHRPSRGDRRALPPGPLRHGRRRRGGPGDLLAAVRGRAAPAPSRVEFYRPVLGVPAAPA